MTYHDRELLVSRSSQPYSHKRTFNNSNNHRYPSRLSPSHILRVECKVEERHFIDDNSPHRIKSSLQPIRYTMNEQFEPVQFRSEIIVHNYPETDLHIKRLHVNFRYLDDTPTNAILHPSGRSQSFHVAKPALTFDEHPKRMEIPAHSPNALHQWIDDICANEQLMANDDIVFL